VLYLLAEETDGELALKEIAREMGISYNTVKTYMGHLRQKLGAVDTSRPAILQAARRKGELPPPGPPPARPGEPGDEPSGGGTG
jgi:DNA-binding CsgD family transcriptional regulator